MMTGFLIVSICVSIWIAMNADAEERELRREIRELKKRLGES